MSGAGLLLLLAASYTVKPGDAVLRKGCESGDEAVATVPAGSAVTIRFSLAGASQPCYKVSVEANGAILDGYLPASALSGLDEFERNRRQAPEVSISATAPPARAPATATPSTEGDAIARAARLLDQNRPQEAYELLQNVAKLFPNEPGVLAMAGLAAYRSDDLQQARDYLQRSLARRPDRPTEQLLAVVQRELSHDRTGEKLFATRFVLRYDGTAVPPPVAREIVAVLEQEFSRVAAQLGCRTDERIITIVQTEEAFRRATDAAEWSGGLYDGKIRVPLRASDRFSAEMRQTLSHELVHACLSNLGPFPTWLHEGMAQRLSGETLDPREVRQIQAWAREKKLPRLNNLSQSWSRLSAQHAALAYTYAHLAVNRLFESYQNYGIHNVLRNPDRLSQVADDLERRLSTF